MENLENIQISFDGAGEYGIHDGFFNAIAVVDGINYDFQCCAESESYVNFDDCGYNEGMCGDANDKLASKIGWENVFELLRAAYIDYKNS